jgi:CRISPR type III-A-associated protein Csm2
MDARAWKAGMDMSELENEQIQAETPAAAPEPEPEPAPAAAPVEAPKAEQPAKREGPPRPRGDRPPKEKNDRGPRPERGERPDRGPRPGGRDPRSGREQGGGRPMGRPDMLAEIDLEKLVADSLYLDNQAHAVVSRIREMESGTRSQIRRLFSAVRRACRAPETDRQHQFVMLRARLAYTIARHQLRSLDPLERLLLQVTRKNDPRGYERFRDLFEAIVAYNE